jgi:ParB-like chromosome segregation protein Spo0J
MKQPQPIDNIRWIDAERLDANDYNPNYVLTTEMKLLKLSLLAQGWIQPVLVVSRLVPVECGGEAPPVLIERYEIIDGFHRSTLCKTDKEVNEMTGGMVPCAVLDLSEADRKMLTVRINRAKGSHVAAKMHELITSLVNDHEVPITELCKQLGADKAEIELLLQESVFKKQNIEDHPYSRAWTVKAK